MSFKITGKVYYEIYDVDYKLIGCYDVLGAPWYCSECAIKNCRATKSLVGKYNDKRVRSYY